MARFPKMLIALAFTAAALLPSNKAFGQNPGMSVAFRNDTKVPVIVQGWAYINKMPRRGQAVLVQPGKTVSDSSLPAGTRFVSVYDANQPTRVYVRDQQIDVPRNLDLPYSIRPHPTNPQRMAINDPSP